MLKVQYKTQVPAIFRRFPYLLKTGMHAGVKYREWFDLMEKGWFRSYNCPYLKKNGRALRWHEHLEKDPKRHRKL